MNKLTLLISAFIVLNLLGCGSQKPFSRGANKIVDPVADLQKPEESGVPNTTLPTEPNNPPTDVPPVALPPPHQYTEQEKEDFFIANVTPAIKSSSCIGCHSESFKPIMKRVYALTKITIGKPESSKLFAIASGSLDHHSATPLSAENIEKIKLWILLEAQ